MMAPGRRDADSISLPDLLKTFPEGGSTDFFMGLSCTKAAGEPISKAIVACVRDCRSNRISVLVVPDAEGGEPTESVPVVRGIDNKRLANAKLIAGGPYAKKRMEDMAT